MTKALWYASLLIGTAAVLGLGLSSVDQASRSAPRDRVGADTTQQVQASADSGSVYVEDGERVRLLIGHVRGRQDSTFLFSDRAYEYPEREEFLFLGNVLIVERGDSLRADTVLYNEATKTGRARGRVRLSDGEVDVRAPSGLYFSQEKRARFEEGVTLIDSLAEITSRKGTYWSDEKRAELEETVRLQAERTYMEADTLTYFRETEVSIARGQVFIERIGGEDEAAADSAMRTLLFGQWAYNDEQAGFSRMKGRPLLVQLRRDSTGTEVDTLVIRAVLLEALDQDSLQRLVAVDSVRIWQRDFAAVADSVVYERVGPAADTLLAGTLAAVRREETRLFRQPMAWVEAAQVSGDTIRVKGRGGDIDSLFVRNNTFVAQHDSATGRIQQLRGRHLVGVFGDDSTRTFTVGPNAEVIYFRKDKDDRLLGGQVSGDLGIFVARNEELERVLFPGEYQGAYYPENVIPEPFQLDGFRWEPERKPRKALLLREDRILQRLEQYARREAPLQEADSTRMERPAQQQRR
ncbi:MAG: OstA-like protein [Rhodothermales bacterium]